MSYQDYSLEINKEKGFDEFDLFNRRPIAESISDLLINSKIPQTILIDAPWGSGKTVFLKQWAGYLLKHRKIKVVEFDAFEADYSKEPFAELAACIYEFVKAQDLKSSVVHSLKKTSWEVVKSAGRTGGRLASAALVHHVIGDNSAKLLQEIENDFSESLGNIVDDINFQQFDQQIEQRKARDELRLLLSSLPAQLSKNDNPTPVIIFVDELDRCRPTFAIELLECVKHFFSVPGIHFVFGAYSEQLYNSVKFVYGDATNAQSYLMKFFDFKCCFPNDVYERGNTPSAIYAHTIMTDANQNYELFPSDQAPDFIKIFKNFCSVRNPTLRETEKIVDNFIIIANSHKIDDRNDFRLFLFLAISKTLEENLYYQKIVTGMMVQSDVEQVFARSISDYKRDINSNLEKLYGQFMLNIASCFGKISNKDDILITFTDMNKQLRENFEHAAKLEKIAKNTLEVLKSF